MKFVSYWHVTSAPFAGAMPGPVTGVERLIFKYLPDVTVLYTQFKSGNVDLLGRPYITPDNYEEARNLPGRVVTVVPMPSVESIYLNLERPQFKELAVREALYAALDREAIIDALSGLHKRLYRWRRPVPSAPSGSGSQPHHCHRGTRA